MTEILFARKTEVDSVLDDITALETDVAGLKTSDVLVKTADAIHSAERVVTDGTSITFDWSTPGQVTAKRAELTGDVTAPANSNAMTIADNVVTYAKMQNVTSARIIGRVTVGTGDPEELTATQVKALLGLDTGDSPQFAAVNIGHASDTTLTRTGAGDIAVEGNVVYRASGTDVPIVDGGTGSSTIGGAQTILGIGPRERPGGRITLTSNLPILTSSVSAATTVYYTPYLNDQVSIYDGTTWLMKTFTNISQETTDNTKSPAAVANNSNYDIFVWDDSGTIRATRGPAWTSDTARGTGAGTTELERVNGITMNKIAITNGPGAQRGTYVGTIRSNGAAQIEWTYGTIAANWGEGKLFVWNIYNRVDVSTFTGDTTDSWTYDVASTWRAANGNATARINFVRGSNEDIVNASYYSAGVAGVGSGVISGVGLDTTTGFTGTTGFHNNSTSTIPIVSRYGALPGIGLHYISANEYNANTTASTWYGDTGLADAVQTGLHVTFKA